MSKGKTPDRRGPPGEAKAAGKSKFSFPPSLSDTPTLRSQQRKKNETRQRKVEEALRLLPLTDTATNVSPFIFAFETTYYNLIRQKDDLSASASLVERQLNELVRKCDKLESHVKGMHRDAITAWANAGSVYDSTNVSIDSGALVLILNEAAERAEIALAALKAARRAAKKGAPPDAMAAAMRETTGFVYKKLTNKRDGRAYSSHNGVGERDTKFIKFLDLIYAAYCIGASARSRARGRRPPMGNNSKK